MINILIHDFHVFLVKFFYIWLIILIMNHHLHHELFSSLCKYWVYILEKKVITSELPFLKLYGMIWWFCVEKDREREREMKREYIQKGVKYKKQIYDYRTLLRSKKDVKRDKILEFSRFISKIQYNHNQQFNTVGTMKKI